MKHEYITLNHVQSHLITFGDPFNCNGQDVIICITGNPGITDFYIDFASELHKLTGMPLCVIGQAGHEIVPDEQSNLLKNQERLFTLAGQLLHKLDLINNYIDRTSKLHLIGHSIGAWLILELLKDNENLVMRIASVNLLFPTLQKMADTRNGKFLNNVNRNFHTFILFLFVLVYMLPVKLVTCLVQIYLKFKSISLDYSKCIMKFLNPKVGEKVLFLAYDEMDTVKELNLAAMNKLKDKINIIYSDRDNWAPIAYMEALQRVHPDIPMREVNIEHAFVLKSSERVAEMVTEFINTKESTI